MKLKYLLKVKTVKLYIIQTWKKQFINKKSTTKKKLPNPFDWDLAMGLSAFAPQTSLNPVVGVPKFWTVSSHASNWNKISQQHSLQHRKRMET